MEEKKIQNKNVLTLARYASELAQRLRRARFKVVYLLCYGISGCSSTEDDSGFTSCCSLIQPPAAASRCRENEQWSLELTVELRV